MISARRTATSTSPAASSPACPPPITLATRRRRRPRPAHAVRRRAAPRRSTSRTAARAGSLQSFNIAQDGTIVGSYSNGRARPIGQLAMAVFANPGGLERVAGVWRATPNSGLAAGRHRQRPAAAARCSPASLEMSNVDLAEEFTRLIVAQRGFQGNARVITTSDEVLQEVVNLEAVMSTSQPRRPSRGAATVRLPSSVDAVARARQDDADRPGDPRSGLHHHAGVSTSCRHPGVDPRDRPAALRRVRPRAAEPDAAHHVVAAAPERPGDAAAAAADRHSRRPNSCSAAAAGPISPSGR